jgi:hypothetical protein
VSADAVLVRAAFLGEIGQQIPHCGEVRLTAEYPALAGLYHETGVYQLAEVM